MKLRAAIHVVSFTCRAAAMLLASVLTGCSESESPVEVQPVKGRVLYRNLPAAGVQVMLHAENAAAAASSTSATALHPNGITDAEGNFRLTTYAKDDGAPPGAYRVTLHWPDENYQPRTLDEKEAFRMGTLKPDRLRGAYANPTTSRLTLTVTKGQSDLPPLAIP
jgi:hypothetical protein